MTKKEEKRGKLNLFLKNFKGQVTIFIIIALIIVALAILFYFLLRKPPVGPVVTENPAVYIETCMKEKIEDTVTNLSLRGGSVIPSNGYYLYQNNTIEYLCYTNEYYAPCVVQQPMLAQHIQEEILNNIEDDVILCFNSMKDNYEKEGYEVIMKSGNTSVDLLPERIVTTFGYEVTLTKSSTNKYENFQIVIPRDTYRFASIASSIIQWETLYGDAEVTTYMNYYHDLKVEKKKQIDETSIYILTNRDTGEKFQFASRSYAFPPGVIV
ncbi:MAG TPA: hypothetical protein PK357_00840 [Candidatus Pacearchaeota archaeon]|nr:hypothetical protein [Candidatus Pacearchaeota archaeon]